ncbi:MAG: AAA family ATPase [Thermoplasmata archaeon]|nr:AAA family ATPase [Thermoplasmata archaeon]
MRITVGGPPGSGTTTFSKELAKRLSLRYVYAGEIFRKEAKRRGLTLEEFSRLAEENPEIDRSLDRLMLEEIRKGNVVAEGRLTGPLGKKEGIECFSIWMDAHPRIRAQRIREREGGNLSHIMKKMKEREESERKRYQEIYDVDIYDLSQYDLIIETSFISPEEEINIALKELRKRGLIQ